MKYLLMLLLLFSISLVSAEVSYEMTWDEDEIINGDEFKINVVIDGEDDELYDGKLWIERKGDIISDRLDSKRDDWKSSYYYINEFFADGENEVTLRIDGEFSGFEGDANIHFRVRGEEEIFESIEILKDEEDDDSDEDADSSNDDIDKSLVGDAVYESLGDEKFENIILEPISLGEKIDTVEEKDIYTENIVYQSKGLKIIEYSVYGFALLCVLLCVLVVWRKLD